MTDQDRLTAKKYLALKAIERNLNYLQEVGENPWVENGQLKVRSHSIGMFDQDNSKSWQLRECRLLP